MSQKIFIQLFNFVYRFIMKEDKKEFLIRSRIEFHFFIIFKDGMHYIRIY